MSDKAIRPKLRKFLSQQPMATISTIDLVSMSPQSALIAFAELEDFRIIFETFYDTRKYSNLKKSEKVSLVIGWSLDSYITVQYEGVAREISKEETGHYRQIFLQKKTPCTEEFLCHPHVRLFIIQPTWIRYSDYTGKIPLVRELMFKG